MKGFGALMIRLFLMFVCLHAPVCGDLPIPHDSIKQGLLAQVPDEGALRLSTSVEVIGFGNTFIGEFRITRLAVLRDKGSHENAERRREFSVEWEEVKKSTPSKWKVLLKEDGTAHVSLEPFGLGEPKYEPDTTLVHMLEMIFRDDLADHDHCADETIEISGMPVQCIKRTKRTEFRSKDKKDTEIYTRETWTEKATILRTEIRIYRNREVKENWFYRIVVSPDPRDGNDEMGSEPVKN